jgi:hypothetical protein
MSIIEHAEREWERLVKDRYHSLEFSVVKVREKKLLCFAKGMCIFIQ